MHAALADRLSCGAASLASFVPATAFDLDSFDEQPDGKMVQSAACTSITCLDNAPVGMHADGLPAYVRTPRRLAAWPPTD